MTPSHHPANTNGQRCTVFDLTAGLLHPYDLIFAGDQGQPLDLHNLTQRQFNAALLLAQGEHPKVVSERLGHASVTLTLDTYSHVLPTMQQQAAERLESALFGTPPSQSDCG